MPSSTLGWTRLEIITSVLDTIGRTGDATLKAKLDNEINLYQLRFWKLYDWKFGHYDGADDGVTLVPAVSTIGVNSNGAGFNLRTTDIEKVVLGDLTSRLTQTLTKMHQRDIIKLDPTIVAGTPTFGVPRAWYTVDDDRISLYPLPNATVIANCALYLYGRRMPTFMDADGDYPDIPIEYQETFIQYCVYRALNRERDPRSSEELILFEKMLKEDKQYDLEELESNYRIKYIEEELGGDGDPSLDNVLWNGD